MTETPSGTDSITRIQNRFNGIKTHVWEQSTLSNRPDSSLAFLVGMDVHAYENRFVPPGGGRRILHAINDAFPYHDRTPERPRELLFHGSPVPPEEINGFLIPKKPTWRNSFGLFDDGSDPVVAMSATPDVTILHALLNRKHPSIAPIADDDLYLLSYKQDIKGNNWYVTSERAIQTLQESEGYVYFFIPPPRTARYFGAAAMRDEYRTTERVKVDANAYVAVHVDDLPPDLIILGTGRVEGEKLFHELGLIDPETFLAKMHKAGVSVRTPSGIFPHEFFQGYKRMK